MELNWLVQLVNTALWFVPLKLAELLIVGVLLVELELELLDDPHDTTHVEIIKGMVQFIAWHQESFKFILIFLFLNPFSFFLNVYGSYATILTFIKLVRIIKKR